MTATQKLKWLILARAAKFSDKPTPTYPLPEVDKIYDDEEGEDYGLQDGRCEVREGEVETKLPCDYSRHYESKSVAAKLPDGSWIGWTYWYGGGKHGEPDAIDWIEHAYDVNCAEEQKMVTIQTFTKK